jgi:hypothetical protein
MFSFVSRAPILCRVDASTWEVKMAAVENSTSSVLSALLASTKDAVSAAVDSNAKQSRSTSSAASEQTDVVQLSDQAKAVLAKAAADQTAAADLTLSFDEILAKRSDALSAKLSKAFAGLNVNLDDAVRLQVDKFGNVTAEGPWKKKIEKLFADDPELAKELKAVAGLNSLKAAKTALDLYNKEKGSTAGSAQQQKAWTNYNIQSINIQTLSGVMSLKDGKLRSAAVDYIDMLADPNGTNGAGSDQAQKQRDVANRLA